MEHQINFTYKEQIYPAKVVLSLQDDGCYVFCIIQDSQLIREFGSDIDIPTDGELVLPDRIIGKEVIEFKTAILEAVKKIPEFRNYQFDGVRIKAGVNAGH